MDCGFLFTKTFSIATQSGLNWSITSSSPKRIILMREAKLVSWLVVFMTPLASYRIFPDELYIMPYPVTLNPGSIPRILLVILINYPLL